MNVWVKLLCTADVCACVHACMHGCGSLALLIEACYATHVYFIFCKYYIHLSYFPPTSLPPSLSSLPLSVPPSQLTHSDTDQIVEARGILSDLLLEKGLEGTTLQRLEQVRSLLTPNTLANAPIVTKVKAGLSAVESVGQVREWNYCAVLFAWIVLCGMAHTVRVCVCACVCALCYVLSGIVWVSEL